jgi:nitrite reductase/ring-hydroxylating ferredoxin subunit
MTCATFHAIRSEKPQNKPRDDQEIESPPAALPVELPAELESVARATAIYRGRAGMEFETVTQKIDFGDGEIVAYDVCETWVALADVGGEVYAIGDLCTHKGCSLGKGTLEGTTVTCPCHGSKFDVTTGAVLEGPATEPAISYRTKVEKGVVYVEI